LLEPLNGTFWVGCIYGRNDDASRFGYFCGAAAEYLRVANIQCALPLSDPCEPAEQCMGALGVVRLSEQDRRGEATTRR